MTEGTKGDISLQRVGRAPDWFTAPLTSVPASGPDTADVAAEARALLLGERRSDEPLLDVAALCDAAMCRLRVEPLRAAAGGLQALLIPRGDGFHIVVDAEPPGGWGTLRGRLRREVSRHRVRFRVAHEVGHTLFFVRTARGVERRLPNSAEQERFCDEFGAELLLPSSAARAAVPSPTSVLALHRRYDVSLALAARAVAAAHPRAACWLVIVRKTGEAVVQWRSKSSYDVALTSRETTALAHESLRRQRLTHRARWRDGQICRLTAAGLLGRAQAVIFAAPPA